MSCTSSGYKTFLVCCNVVLLFVGVSVFVLGLKMSIVVAALYLTSISMIMKVVKSVVATGFFISMAGISGICGACYESLWLLLVHLVSLGVIVIMEFTLGVTLMVVKKTIATAMASVNCNNVCAATLDELVLDYALPSAGLMMTIIIVEALMIYSSIRLYFYIRDRPKVVAGQPSIVVQNVQMQNVVAPQPMYPSPVQPLYEAHMEYMPHQPQPLFAAPQHPADAHSTPKPPEYSSLPTEPPTYDETMPSTDVEAQRTTKIRSGSVNSV